MSELAQRSPLSAEELQASIHIDGESFSRPAIYKELLLLKNNGVIVQAKGRYRLALTWIFDCVAYAENLLLQSSKGRFARDLIPDHNKKRSWCLYEHRSVDRLWAQITAELLQRAQNPVMFQALPHRWWPLLHRDLGRQFRGIVRRSEATSYCVIGGNTHLDRLFAKILPGQSFRSSIAPGFFEDGEFPFVTVIDDYIVTTNYPTRFTRSLHDYFSRITSERQILPQEVLELFESPGKITTTVRHAPAHAGKLRRRFERHFGLIRSR